MQRIAQVIALAPETVERYKEMHAAVWPDVLRTIRACGITNYSIFLREPELLLFAYYEYVGDDSVTDAARMAADPVTQEWWALTMPLQRPLETRGADEYWATATEVFHTD